MNDKRNYSFNRGDGETLESYLGRINECISKLEWQSEGHRQWYTHKNPYGCWICEALQILRLLESELLVFSESDREDSYEDEHINMTKSDEL